MSLLSVLQLAKAYGMDFFETSAFTNHNITEVRRSGEKGTHDIFYDHVQTSNKIRAMHAVMVIV